MAYSRLTTNLGTAQKRYETFNGKKHLVLPTVGLVEGVHPGSKGPLLYRKSELSRNLDSWNYRPAMINHPTLNGAGISACEPAVIERQSVGHLFNTAYDGRLRFETWVDEEKLEVLAPDVHRKVIANEANEVSTGLHHDIEETAGEWNGEKYGGIVLNMMGDHLAILTNEKGACDVTKGAGLLVNADGTELSYGDVRQMLSAAIKETLTAGSEYCYVCDVFPKYAVYEANGGMYKVGYSIRKGKVTLTDGPSEVRRQTSYVLTDNGLILLANSVNGNNLVLPSSGGGATIPPNITETDPMAQQPNKTTTNNPGAPNPAEARKSAIDEMIAGGFIPEAERATLEGLSEGVFVATHKGFQATKTPAPTATTPAPTVPAQGAAAVVPPQTGAPAPASTAEQWLEQNNAPPEICEVVINARNIDRQKRPKLIENILAKPGNMFAKEWLEAQKTPLLEGMARLGATPTANTAAPMGGYAGQATPPMFINGAGNPPTTNAGEASPLDDPYIDFAS